MRKSAVIALLLSSTTAIQRHHRNGAPEAYSYFATGMNGDEDLAQDITMKGEKFHYAQDNEQIQLNDNVNGLTQQKKGDIRGPSTDGPTKGVYQWPTPAPTPAPIPGPYGPTTSLTQKGDIRGPSTDAPTKGVYQWPSAPSMAPIPGPYGPTTSLSQKKGINHTEEIQSVAGTDVTNQTSDVVHTIAMKMADPYPQVARDLMGPTNSMWTYPKNLDPSMEPKAHIYGAGVTKEVKASEDAQAEKDKTEKTAKVEAKADAAKDAKAAKEDKEAVAAADGAKESKKEDAAPAKEAKESKKEEAAPAKEAKAPAKEEAKSLVQTKTKWDIDHTPKQGDRDYVNANMWTYPKKTLQDKGANNNDAKVEDLEDAEKARVADKVKADAAGAKLDVKIAEDKTKADAKKEAKESKVAAAKKTKDDKAEAKAALKGADGAKKAASLAQTHDHDEGYEDKDFKPHPILKNTIHNDRMQKIQSVAGPSVGAPIGASVHASSMEGGEPNPEKSRNLIKNYPMFTYPASPSAPGAANGIPADDVPSVAVDPKAVEASKALRAKEAAADDKEEKAAKAVKEDIKAFGSLAQHPILPDPLHQARLKDIQSVAGPAVGTDQIGASVHASAMEGGEPIPEPRRDLVTPGFNPSFDASKQASTVATDAGQAAERDNNAKGAAINAKEAAAAAGKSGSKQDAAKAPAAAPAAALVQKKSAPATGSASYGNHAILDDTLHADMMQKIQSVAGPAVTDQIGASVHASAMEGGDPNPDLSRSILHYDTPSSFRPDYSKSTMKSTGDIADAEGKAKGAALNAVAASKAAEEAKVQAQMKAESDKKVGEDIAALNASQPKTIAGKEAKEAKLKALDGKVEAKIEEQKEAAKEAIANSDSKKDKDVVLLKMKNKK